MPSGGRHERVHSLDDELMTVLKELGGTEAAVPEDGELREPVPPVAHGDHRVAVTRRITESTGTVHT
jgi:surfactin synthase thioesterase subunit